jgi:hypothetical protein
VVPPTDTHEECAGELLDYLRSHDADFQRAYIIHYAKSREGAWRHNPWVLWFSGPHGLPSKMPLWVLERTSAKRPLAWEVVPPDQGELF